MGDVKLGRPKIRGDDYTKMTLVISEEDRDIVKDYAVAHRMSASGLFHAWIEQHCSES